jgi:ribosomal protein S18 acetylase RimI-like enzyme
MRQFYFLLLVPSDSLTYCATGNHHHRHDSSVILFNTLSTSVVKMVSPPNSDPLSTVIAFQMREATNVDTNLVIGFLSQLRSFHDGLLTGSGSPPHSALLIKEGNTIQSLMPHIQNCHVILAQPTFSDGCLGLPIGFASYHLKYSGFGPPLMHVEHLFVDSSSRNQGAGFALMNELADISKNAQCSHMEWNVDQRNIRGVAFYHRIGATRTGRTDNDSSDDSTTMNWIPTAWDQ